MAIFSHNAILSIFTDVIKEANRVYYHQYNYYFTHKLLGKK